MLLPRESIGIKGILSFLATKQQYFLRLKRKNKKEKYTFKYNIQTTHAKLVALLLESVKTLGE
ncbi:MAG: hypothetical protein RSB44_03795 [Carnobacterium sp.]